VTDGLSGHEVSPSNTPDVRVVSPDDWPDAEGDWIFPNRLAGAIKEGGKEDDVMARIVGVPGNEATPEIRTAYAAARARYALMVELTAAIAWENFRARFNHAMGLGAQGFSEGAYCALPEG
jgi:hypothetical protein